MSDNKKKLYRVTMELLVEAENKDKAENAVNARMLSQSYCKEDECIIQEEITLIEEEDCRYTGN